MNTTPQHKQQAKVIVDLAKQLLAAKARTRLLRHRLDSAIRKYNNLQGDTDDVSVDSVRACE